jgi:hypothetical protein
MAQVSPHLHHHTHLFTPPRPQAIKVIEGNFNIFRLLTGSPTLGCEDLTMRHLLYGCDNEFAW